MILRNIVDTLTRVNIRRGSLYISGHVQGEPLQILVDEGAEATLVSPEILEQIPVHNRPVMYDSPYSVTGLKGIALDVRGQVELTLDIGGIKVQQMCLVVGDLIPKNIDMLLGNDFTELNDYHNRTYYMKAFYRNREIPLYKTRLSCTRGRLLLKEDMELLPNKPNKVFCTLDGHPVKREMVSEEIPHWSHENVRIAPGVVDLWNRNLVIEIFNSNNEIYKLKKGELLTTLNQFAQVSNVSDLTATERELTASNIRLQINRLEVSLKQQTLPEPVFVGKIDLDAQTGSVDSTNADITDTVTEDSSEGSTYLPEGFPEHMKCMMQGIDRVLSPGEIDQLSRVLMDLEDVFQQPDMPLGRTDAVQHTIDIQGHHPIKQAPRRLAYQRQQIVLDELKKMLDQDVIRPSSSPWASPVVLVTKKDGTTRFCIDYRMLNDITKKDSYPLPRIDECLDTLAGAKYFCTLDLASGYWQVGMLESDKEKTAFSTKFGLYEFKVMPFGLCNAPATFERLTEKILRGMQWTECLVYIDDIIIFGRTFLEVLARLRKVLERFRAHKLKMKPKKCDLFKEQVEFLGHIVSAEGIACDPKKVDRVKNWPQPRTVTEVRGFLGLSGYYRRFIQDYSTIAGPLLELTKKGMTFQWSASCERAFEALKAALIEAPVLAYPDNEKPYILDTDASGYAMGGVLSQTQDDGAEKPVAYASYAFDKGQKNYCTTNRELLAVVKMVKCFKQYLQGSRQFLVRSDHNCLRWLQHFKDSDGMVGRWIQYLETYNYKIIYREGKKHANADALSRLVNSPFWNDQRPDTKLCEFVQCKDCILHRTAENVDKCGKHTDLEFNVLQIRAAALEIRAFVLSVKTRAMTKPTRQSPRLLAREEKKLAEEVAPVKPKTCLSPGVVGTAPENSEIPTDSASDSLPDVEQSPSAQTAKNKQPGYVMPPTRKQQVRQRIDKKKKALNKKIKRRKRNEYRKKKTRGMRNPMPSDLPGVESDVHDNLLLPGESGECQNPLRDPNLSESEHSDGDQLSISDNEEFDPRGLGRAGAWGRITDATQSRITDASQCVEQSGEASSRSVPLDDATHKVTNAMDDASIDPVQPVLLPPAMPAKQHRLSEDKMVPSNDERHNTGEDKATEMVDLLDREPDAIIWPRNEHSNWLQIWKTKDLENWQREDPEIRHVFPWLATGVKPSFAQVRSYGTMVKALWSQWPDLVQLEGVVYRKWKEPGKSTITYQLVAPMKIRSKIFKELHGKIAVGHQGVHKTIAAVRQRFYWPGLRADIRLWCKKCRKCQENRARPFQRDRVPLTKRHPGGPMEQIAFDILSLTKTSRGNVCVLMVCDFFTKWAEAYALPDHKARTIADVINRRWVCYQGAPRELHSDRGTELRSDLLTSVYDLLQIEKTFTTAHRPQSNGACERMNKTICHLLRTFADEWDAEEWDDHLDEALCSYRRTVHCSTNVTPNMMVLNRETCLPIDWIVGPPPTEPMCTIEFVYTLRNRHIVMNQFVRDTLGVSADQQKRGYDRYAGPPRYFNAGDNVYYYYQPREKKISDRPWDHYIVRRQIDRPPYAILYEIMKGEHQKPRRVHIDKLRTYHGWDPIEKWWEDEDLKPEDIIMTTTAIQTDIEDLFRTDKAMQTEALLVCTEFRSDILEGGAEDDISVPRKCIHGHTFQAFSSRSDITPLGGCYIKKNVGPVCCSEQEYYDRTNLNILQDNMEGPVEASKEITRTENLKE